MIEEILEPLVEGPATKALARTLTLNLSLSPIMVPVHFLNHKYNSNPNPSPNPIHTSPNLNSSPNPGPCPVPTLTLSMTLTLTITLTLYLTLTPGFFGHGRAGGCQIVRSTAATNADTVNGALLPSKEPANRSLPQPPWTAPLSRKFSR